MSIFTGHFLLAFGGHSNATFGAYGEIARARNDLGNPTQYGVVTYKNGSLHIPCSNGTVLEVPFHRLLLYHNFYKQSRCLINNTLHEWKDEQSIRFISDVFRSLGFEKCTLLRSPRLLSLRLSITLVVIVLQCHAEPEGTQVVSAVMAETELPNSFKAMNDM